MYEECSGTRTQNLPQQRAARRRAVGDRPAFRSFRSLTMPREKVCLVGSGNWGSAIARIIGANTASHPETFEREVQMWVFEEVVGGKKLTEIINTTHENVKYLPGAKLPTNVVANPSLASAASGATMLIFVLPHQFLRRICPDILRSMAPRCKAISLIKGIEFEAGRPKLISSMIHEALSAAVPVSVLMGANVASEVAKDEFCEATIGCADAAAAAAWRLLFDLPTFRIQTVDDVAGVELCGALKNVVALGAGFCDGLGLGGNTKVCTYHGHTCYGCTVRHRGCSRIQQRLQPYLAEAATLRAGGHRAHRPG